MATSMENEIERYLLGDPIEASKVIAAEINKGSNVKFVNFIESLEAGLTNTDNVTRGRATHMIGDVVEMLPPSFLSQEQGGMVTKFLLAKLRDHHSVQPHALQSLAVLTSRCPLEDETVREICQTIFQEVQNQTLSHADRGATYKILQNFLEGSTQTLKNMGGDFVIGFIQQMDAEKDPRNLLVCFNCAYFICSNFSLGAFTEEMFEILGCYFPVDFVPPPNNPHGITKEELVIALRKCFGATPQFADYSVPLLLEKMTSDLQSARTDSFITLTECAPVYGQKGLTPFLGSITSIVKREVLMNISTELVEAAKCALRAVYRAVTSSTTQTTKNFSSADENIVELYQDVVKYLDGTDLKKSCLAFSLCGTVADSSAHALLVIIPLVLPHLVSCCHKHAQAPEQFSFVKELNRFLHVIHNHKGNSDVIDPVKSLVKPIYTIFEKLLKSTSQDLQLEAVRGLSLISTSGIDDDAEQVQHFLDTLITKALAVPSSDLRKEVLLSLRAAVEEDAKLSEKTIESLIQQSTQDNFTLAVDSLVHTVVNTKSFFQVNEFFLKVINQDILALAEHSEQLLSCARAFEQLLHQISKMEIFSQVQTATVLPIVCCSFQASVKWTEENKKSCQTLMGCFRNAFSVIGESMEKSDVTSLWNKLACLFLDGDIQDLNLSEDIKKFRPLQPDSPWQQTCLVALLEGFVTSADVQALVEQRDQFFEAVYVLALHSEDEFTHISACRCVAAIMNKAPIGSQIQWFLEPMVEKLKKTMIAENPVPSRLRAVRLWLWLTKAMECRGHSATTILSSHLVNLLGDPDLGSEIGRNLSMIVQDMDDMFSIRHHSIVTPLYKQRFFSLNLKTLINGYNNAISKEAKQNHLLAVSGIVSKLPLQVTKPHLPLLLPLLMLALKDKENPNLCTILSTLSLAGASDPEIVTSNMDSLIVQLLDLSINSINMKVRIAALDCLEQLTGLPSHVLVPHQTRVVRELKYALDDKKRLVRRQAAETRSAWILLRPEMKS